MCCRCVNVDPRWGAYKALVIYHILAPFNAGAVAALVAKGQVEIAVENKAIENHNHLKFIE